MDAGVTPTSQRDELTIGASGAEVRRASEWLSATCVRREIPSVQAQQLEICLNEVLANVLDHGGSAASAVPILLQLEVRSAAEAEADEARVTVSDASLAFNPLTVQVPPRAHTLADARAGGLGLTMIRRCSLARVSSRGRA